MKTTFTFLFAFLSITLFGQTIAIHPDCQPNPDALVVKQCTEEKIAQYIHDKIKYGYYYDGKTSKATIELTINNQGMIEGINVSILEGEDAKNDMEKALKDMAFHTFFKAATDGNSKVTETKKMEVVFEEKDFSVAGHVKIEKPKFEPIVEESIVESEPEKSSISKKNPPILPEKEVEEIFKVVEEMPRFYSAECEQTDISKKKKKSCADEKMLDFIYQNLNYPAIARENSVEGTVVIQFIVETDGRITNARTIRDIGAQCGAEALKLVNSMNDYHYWTPGKQRNIPVRVQFNLPIKFRLDENQQMVIPERPKTYTGEIFEEVDEAPRIYSKICEALNGDFNEKQECADRKMLEFVYSRIKYPAMAREKGIEGEVVLQFVVEKDGNISNLMLLNEIGEGCGSECLRVINLLKKQSSWLPGKLGGKNVRVLYKFPVKFRLE